MSQTPSSAKPGMSGWKRETWRPQPTSSWTPGQPSNGRAQQITPASAAGPSRHTPPPSAYPGSSDSRAPEQSSSTYRSGERDDRRDRDDRDDRVRVDRSYRPDRGVRPDRPDRNRDRNMGGRIDDSERRWSAWKNRVEPVRDDDRRRGGDTNGERSWSAWKDKVDNGDREDLRQRRRDDRDDRRPRDRKGDRDKDDGRSWSAWKDKVWDDDRRRDDGRRKEDDRRREPERNDRREGGIRSDTYRPPPRTPSPSGSGSRVPPPRREDRSPPSGGPDLRRSPDYAVGGRRASPDYDAGEGGPRRNRSPPRRSPSPDPAFDRKRPPPSPRLSDSKRQRDSSPAHSIISSRRRMSLSPSPDRFPRRDRRSPSPRPAGDRWQRSPPPGDRMNGLGNGREHDVPPPRRVQPDYSPASQASMSSANTKPSLASQFEMFRSEEAQVWRRDEGPPFGLAPDVYPPENARGRNGFPAPPAHGNDVGVHGGFPNPLNEKPSTINGHEQYSAPKSKAPAARTQVIAQDPLITGSVRIDLGAGSVSPVKSGWKSISTAQMPKRSAVQQFFEEPNTPSSKEEASKPVSPAYATNGRRTSESPTKPGVHLQRPDIYLDQIASAERQYTQHLSTIAPYIKAAFTQWYAQDATPPLPDFLVHYFGRPPNGSELQQIQQLLSLKTQLSRDQEELRLRHSQAVKSDSRGGTSNGHWSPGPEARGRRASRRSSTSSSRSPGKMSNYANDIPLPDRSRYPGVSAEPAQELARPEVQSTIVQLQLSQVATASPAVATPSSNHSDAQAVLNALSTKLADGETYERLSCVGEGTYGKVYKARNVETGAFVALKRIRMEGEKDGFPVTAMREIKLLQSLRDDNVVRLHEMMVSKGSVYMVLEYMDHDLTGLLAHPEVTFSPANSKSLVHQMLSGLAYLHRKAILHRDMKGSNILLNARGELKLADFGLARIYHKRKRNDYTNRVITLWYRSPELLLGETVYGPEVDLWSAGCIMLELFATKPVFQGSDEIHQLEVIYSVLGTPSESDWPGVKELPWYELVKPKEALPSRFRAYFTKWLSPGAMDLAEGLLFFDPQRRLSAASALKTGYFTSEEPEMEKPTQLAGCGEHHEMSAKLDRQRRRQEGK